MSTTKGHSLDGKLVKTSDIKPKKIQILKLSLTACFIELLGRASKAEVTKIHQKKLFNY